MPLMIAPGEKLQARTSGLFLIAVLEKELRGKDSMKLSQLVEGVFMGKLPGVLDLELSGEGKITSDTLYHTLPALKAAGYITMQKIQAEKPWGGGHTDDTLITLTKEGRDLGPKLILPEDIEAKLAARG